MERIRRFAKALHSGGEAIDDESLGACPDIFGRILRRQLAKCEKERDSYSDIDLALAVLCEKYC